MDTFLLAYSLLWSGGWISDFHTGYPGSIPGQAAKISLQDHSLLSL